MAGLHWDQALWRSWCNGNELAHTLVRQGAERDGVCDSVGSEDGQSGRDDSVHARVGETGAIQMVR